MGERKAMADDREAFMAAIVKLADDPEFRRSFLTHYQQWLYPPVLVNGDVTEKFFDGRPGAITPVTDEEMRAHREGRLVFVARDD